MIQYDPHHWRSHLFDIRGSMLREIFSRIAVCVIWSLIVVVWHQTKQTPAINIPLHGHTLTGVALGLLLVFRTNVSYERFWEGRRQWGNIVNDCRNLARLSCSLLKSDPDLLVRWLHWTMVFPWSVMNRLRGQKTLGAIAFGLSPSDIAVTENAQHVPLAVSRRMTEQLETARQRGLISDIQQMTLDGGIQRLIDALGACERIHNTPLPFAYMVHLRRALICYLLTLPMALVADFGWLTIPATLLIAYVMLGIEEIGVEIEDPFGEDENDLPLQSMCETIENNLRDLMPQASTRTLAGDNGKRDDAPPNCN